MDCELCSADMALFGDENAFVRYDNDSLSKGHILVVPRRHVADFFEMTWLKKCQLLLCWTGRRRTFRENTHPMATTLVSISARRGVNHACTSTYTLSRGMSVMLQTRAVEYVASFPVCQSTNVRFGSKADICSATGHVRSTPESGQCIV
jgi:HIT domain